MKIVNQQFDIIDPVDRQDGISLLKKVEYFGRISHGSEDKQTENSWDKFINAVVITHGDWSIVEHASASVILKVDRGITHELVRHRLMAITQSSTRFINYGKGEGQIEVIAPSWPETLANDEKVIAQTNWQLSMERAEQDYMHMLAQHISPQIARSVLPTCLAATIGLTCNLRNWRHIFLMRTSKETHVDARKIMIPILEEFQRRIPILYDDIKPEARQIDNLSKPR